MAVLYALLALAIVAATILLPRHFFPRTEINKNNNNRETNEKKYDVMDMAVLYARLALAIVASTILLP